MVVFIQGTILAFLLHFHLWKGEVLNLVVYSLDELVFCQFLFFSFVLCVILLQYFTGDPGCSSGMAVLSESLQNSQAGKTIVE